MARQKKAKRPRGRPSVYSHKKAAEICERLANGETLRAICRDPGMPNERTVRGWALDDQHPFFPQYARAREIGYYTMADELLEIADDGSNDWMERNAKDTPGWMLNGEHVQRSKIRVDTRKWLLSRALPKIYGDKVISEITGRDGGPIETTCRIDLAKLTEAELAAYRVIAAAASRNRSGDRAAASG